MIHIITDSTADFPAEWAQKYDFHIMPMKVIINEKTYLDGVTLSKSEFYELVSEANTVPATSCPAPGEWVELVKKIASPGDSILSIHLSSTLSGSYNSALAAAKELAGEYNLMPYDTLGGSAYTGYLLKETREMIDKGLSVDEIIKKLNYIRKNAVICFSLDTIKFAVGSGRYGGIKQAIASVVRIKPIVYFQDDGSMQISGVARTLNKAMQRLINNINKKYGDVPLKVGVMYANVRGNGEKFMEKIKENVNYDEIIFTDINLTLSSHIGPGAVGMIAYPAEQD